MGDGNWHWRDQVRATIGSVVADGPELPARHSAGMCQIEDMPWRARQGQAPHLFCMEYVAIGRKAPSEEVLYIVRYGSYATYYE